MTNYKIEIAESIEKTLKKLPQKDKKRILEKINALANNPRPEGYRKLQGSRRPSLYRIRSGIYRIIYVIKDEILLVLVVEIGHRKEVYK